MPDDEYKETATLDQDGKVLSLECDGVSMPAGYGFAAVNDWVHDTGRHFEELQWHALGAANAYDQLQAKADAIDDLVTPIMPLATCSCPRNACWKTWAVCVMLLTRR